MPCVTMAGWEGEHDTLTYWHQGWLATYIFLWSSARNTSWMHCSDWHSWIESKHRPMRRIHNWCNQSVCYFFWEEEEGDIWISLGTRLVVVSDGDFSSVFCGFMRIVKWVPSWPWSSFKWSEVWKLQQVSLILVTNATDSCLCWAQEGVVEGDLAPHQKGWDLRGDKTLFNLFVLVSWIQQWFQDYVLAHPAAENT